MDTLVLSFFGFSTRGGRTEMTILTRRALRVSLRVALRRGPFTRLACLMSKAHLVLSLSFAVRRCFRPESTRPTWPTFCVLCGRAFGRRPLSGSANLVGCAHTRVSANAHEHRYTTRHRCVQWGYGGTGNPTLTHSTDVKVTDVTHTKYKDIQKSIERWR